MHNILSIGFVSLLIVSTLAAAQDTQKRNSLLSKQAGRKNIFQKTTTTSTEAPAYEDGDQEYVDEEGEFEENEQASSTTTTTTEAPKKMIRPSVRPMRSNEDLLSALKKRRLNEKNKPQVKTAATQEEKQQQQQFDNEAKALKVKTTGAPKATLNHKRFGALKSTNVKTPVQDDNHAQTIEEPASSKTFKRSNRFSSSRQN